jgi:hypothetical protein
MRSTPAKAVTVGDPIYRVDVQGFIDEFTIVSASKRAMSVQRLNEEEVERYGIPNSRGFPWFLEEKDAMRAAVILLENTISQGEAAKKLLRRIKNVLGDDQAKTVPG